MSTTTTQSEKGEESIDDGQRADHASDAFMVGIDTEGREHYFSRIRDCITVLDDGEHSHTEPLDGRPLSAWMAFIEQEHGGWSETNTFSGSLTDHLCTHLDAGVGGDA